MKISSKWIALLAVSALSLVALTGNLRPVTIVQAPTTQTRAEKVTASAVSLTPIASLSQSSSNCPEALGGSCNVSGGLYADAVRIDIYARTSSSTATLNLIEYYRDDSRWVIHGSDCTVTTALTLCRYITKRGNRHWHVYKSAGSMAYVAIDEVSGPTAGLGTIEPGGSGGSGPALSDATPAGFGTAAAGVSADASRADHVHSSTLPAGVSLGMAAGAGGLSLGSATGDWILPTGTGTYLGASGKALSLRTTAANITIATVTSGTISIDTASSTQAINIGTSTGGNVTLGRAATAVQFAGQANLNAGVDLTTSVGASDLDFSLSTGGTWLPSGNISYTGASNKTINLATTGGSGSITLQTSTADILLTIITNGASLNLVGSTGRFSLTGTGGGGIAYNGTDRWALRVGSQVFTLGATSGSTTAGYSFTGAAHTTLTASTERVIFDVNMAQSVQFAAGALTTQRGALFRAPTYRFVSASTLTNAATLAIDGPPVASTNATITNPWALWVQSGTSRFDGAVSLGSTISGDGSGLTGIVSGVFTAGAEGALAAATTRYLNAVGVTWSSGENPVFIATKAMTIRHLYCYMSTAPGGGGAGTLTATVRKNGSDQLTACTITDPATTCDNTADTFTVAAGDRVSMKGATNASANNGAALTCTFSAS